MNPTGTEGEDVARYVASLMCFPDFVYARPPRTDGRELCDVLIALDGDYCVIQVKTKRCDKPPDRWFKKESVRNRGQINGGARALIAGDVDTLENQRRGRIRIAPPMPDRVYGLGIYVLSPENSLLVTDQPRLKASRHPILELSIRDLMLLVHTDLTTAADFFDWLRFRSDTSQQVVFINARELDAVPVFSCVRNGPVGAVHAPAVARMWDLYALMPATSDRWCQERQTRKIDRIIDFAHTLARGRAKDDTHEYGLIAVELAKLPRAMRSYIEQWFVQARSRGLLAPQTYNIQIVICKWCKPMVVVDSEANKEVLSQILESAMLAVLEGYQINSCIGLACDMAGSGDDIALAQLDATDAEAEGFAQKTRKASGLVRYWTSALMSRTGFLSDLPREYAMLKRRETR